MHKRFGYVIAVFVLILAGAGTWFFLTVGERKSPVVAVPANVDVIGHGKVLVVTFSDSGRGLGRTEIVITQDNQPHTVSAVDDPESGVLSREVSATVDAAALKLHDGPASLTLSAVDRSLWKNRVVKTLPVTIDLLPPQIFQINNQNHINPGGSCVVAYRLSEEGIRTGVQVGDIFYPAHPDARAGQNGYTTYFALPMDASAGNPQIRILAQDRAGNETTSSIPAQIRKRNFRADQMPLSDGFLEQKMPEFQALIPELRGKAPLETFIYVNTILRADNLKTIQSACMKTESRALWHGPFLRMKNAAPMALFGDRRTYLYGGKPVGESVHNGVDLASVVHAPIEAANTGIVRFTGLVGIYGNTVIIDHGLGLSTLYAHLSSIEVKTGQSVNRGDVIGRSGSSGLAGGDHLHFSVAVNGQCVDPREWWDPHWIADNVTGKTGAAF